MTESAATIVVKAAFDTEAGVWYVKSSDLPGLNVEAPSVEAFTRQVELAASDLIEASGSAHGRFDVPIEIIAHASGRARGPAIA